MGNIISVIKSAAKSQQLYRFVRIFFFFTSFTFTFESFHQNLVHSATWRPFVSESYHFSMKARHYVGGMLPLMDQIFSRYERNSKFGAFRLFSHQTGKFIGRKAIDLTRYFLIRFAIIWSGNPRNYHASLFEFHSEELVFMLYALCKDDWNYHWLVWDSTSDSLELWADHWKTK